MGGVLPSGPWGAVALACLLACLLGGLAALGQAPWSLWWLSLPCFTGLFWLLRDASTPRRAILIGWSGGTGYFAISLFWIVEPFLVDIARHGWMAPFALVFMATGFGLFWAAAFGLAQRYGGASSVLSAVIMLTGFELLRGVILTGFPWATIGHLWVETPVLQLAAYGGVVGLSFLALLVAAAPLVIRPVIGGGVSVILLSLAWALGATQREAEPPLSQTTVRLVQPNVPQHHKWDPAEIPTNFGRLLQITAEPADHPLDLIVWPETALATRLDLADIALGAISEAANGVPVVVGANDAVLDDGSERLTYRNTLAVLNGDGNVSHRYYKHHLVPFGEYIPLGEVLARFGIRGLAARDGAGYGAGPGPEILEVEGVGKILPLICYELIFPRHLRTPERPDMIVQITNDAWFGNISGPYQHLAQARFRAVEQGISVIRAANTGVSAVIDPQGRVLRHAPLNEVGYIDATIPAALEPTIYGRLGDWPFAFALVLLFGVSCMRRKSD